MTPSALELDQPATARTATPISDRRSAVVAGVGLLVVAVLAPFAVLGVIDEVVAGGRPADGRAFWLAVGAVVVIALLDLVVAAAVWRLFGPVGARLALLAGVARALYGVVYLIAIGFLATGEPANIDRYQRIWNLGLLLFGVHLLIVGVLCWRSAVVPRLVGALVGLAGIGYLVDLAQYLFVGEVVLMLWLLWWGLGLGGRARATRP